MKTECLQIKRDTALFGIEKKGTLIKCFFTQEMKEALGGA